MGTQDGAVPRGTSQTTSCVCSRSRTLPALPASEISGCETLPCSFSLDSLWNQHRLKQVTELNHKQTLKSQGRPSRDGKNIPSDSYWRRRLHRGVWVWLSALWSLSSNYKNGAFLLKKSCLLLSHYHSQVWIRLAGATIFKFKCRNVTHHQFYGASSGFTPKKSSPEFTFLCSNITVFLPVLYSATF